MSSQTESGLKQLESILPEIESIRKRISDLYDTLEYHNQKIIGINLMGCDGELYQIEERIKEQIS